MDRRTRWVLLAYRLPREPSTPRQLRRLGVAHALTRHHDPVPSSAS